ncbi:MAG: hypothetical protein QNJ00_14830 [Woeseiaceae bacterium]|nr:hypothetical protein [Woeseiaceae bacterium]
MDKIVVISACIGLLQVIDGFLLYRNRGAVDGIATVISTIEFIWFFVLAIWIGSEGAEGPKKMIAASYLVYMAIGIAISIWLNRKSDQSVVVPRASVLAGIAFGSYFFIANAWLLMAGGG